MEEKPTSDFVPKGAIAFFALMIGFYVTLWMIFYYLLVGRQ